MPEESPMKITYDREVDALYIRFKETTVTTKHLAEGIAADYDADGRLAGIEILDAKKQLGNAAAFKQVVLEDIAMASPN
jgi:YD repeat-containing protein